MQQSTTLIQRLGSRVTDRVKTFQSSPASWLCLLGVKYGQRDAHHTSAAVTTLPREQTQQTQAYDMLVDSDIMQGLHGYLPS